jgi:hypothetical protein
MAALRPTFTTTMRVIDWVHRNTTNVRATAQPAALASLTYDEVLVISVSNLSNRSDVCRKNVAQLARR